MVTNIDVQDFWDVRNLAAFVEEQFMILKEDLPDENVSFEEKDQATRAIKAVGEALADFRVDFKPLTVDQLDAEDREDFVYGEDIPDLLVRLGDEYGVTLIHDSYVEEKLEDDMLTMGYFSDRESADFLISFIDFDKLANNHKQSGYWKEFIMDGETYWIE